MQRTTSSKMLMGSCAAAAFVVAPGMAGATKSYQGDDWSQDFDDFRQIQTCDQESDGKDVHSDVELRSGSRVGRASVDTDGPGGACGTSVWFKSDIREHRTCEEIDLYPDKCGNWQGTGA